MSFCYLLLASLGCLVLLLAPASRVSATLVQKIRRSGLLMRTPGVDLGRRSKLARFAANFRH